HRQRAPRTLPSPSAKGGDRARDLRAIGTSRCDGRSAQRADPTTLAMRCRNKAARNFSRINEAQPPSNPATQITYISGNNAIRDCLCRKFQFLQSRELSCLLDLSWL